MFALPALRIAARPVLRTMVARAAPAAVSVAPSVASGHHAHSRCFCASTEKFSGQCHCGEVHFELDGVPNASVVCHCSICRITHSAANAELLAYDPDKVRITKGKDNLHMYNIFGKSQEDRYSCTTCGSKVYSVLNHLGGAKAVFLQNLTTPNHGADGKIDPRFASQFHIFYGSGTVSVKDGLPKYETMPAALGGDDKTLPDNYHD